MKQVHSPAHVAAAAPASNDRTGLVRDQVFMEGRLTPSRVAYSVETVISPARRRPSRSAAINAWPMHRRGAE
jgi:hypothetical protein